METKEEITMESNMIFTDYVKKTEPEFYDRVDSELKNNEAQGCDNINSWLRYWLIQYGYRYSTGKSPHPQNIDGLIAWSLAEDYNNRR